MYFVEYRNDFLEFNMLENIFRLKYIDGAIRNWKWLSDVMINVSRRSVKRGDAEVRIELR